MVISKVKNNMSIEKENKKIDIGVRKIRRGATTTNKVKRIKNTPLYRTSGNLRMATSGVKYRFPNPFGAKQVTFFGIASRNDGVVRVDVFGMAQLAPSYYFTPQDGVSVGLAGPKQKVIQAGKWFLVTTGAAPQYRARSIETTLVNIDWPTSNDIVARAEIVDFGPDYFEVEVILASGWEINGNFMCV
jgi:hypothetical protein